MSDDLKLLPGQIACSCSHCGQLQAIMQGHKGGYPKKHTCCYCGYRFPVQSTQVHGHNYRDE
jgi:hypothetical protein